MKSILLGVALLLTTNQMPSYAQNVKDQEFLNHYRTLAARQSHSELLINTLNQNPTGHIRLAQNLCNSLKNGKTERELMQSWVSFWRNSSKEIVQAAIQSGNIMFTIAPKHYCPEFSSP
ncbi:hypothetical protein ACE1B6_25035 [Aerosakkonemataceae cyanobacterium BLCC-F154]|uniref:Uncharacterized protein n=1 Tax=Floridaenema fluviatile BLCC-F154 TaxID=3153640 RepID=A0ABV4YI68_9CYAN